MARTLVSLLIPFLFGLAGYRQASANERRSGEQAWGMPAILWAAICSLSLLVGAVLFSVATHGKEHAPKTEWRLLRGVGVVVLFLVGGFTMLVAVASGASDESSGLLGPAIGFGVGAAFAACGVLVLRAGRGRARTAASGRFVI